ncbi:MAG: hypothetical protein J6W94_05330 [Bacteroidales bacterium]|nr:hypothetical protein [Bacteroidales bacterium]MBP5676415.1 hypothetical protein [Bacteroidales bacterium]
MTDKIILSIPHSDDYTDFLFLTAALTNKRIVPMLDPTREQIAKESDHNTLVLRCLNIHEVPGPGKHIVSADAASRTVKLLSRYYLSADGTVDAGRADMARAAIASAVEGILLEPKNLREAFRLNFPLLWAKRRQIIDNPQMFFVFSGRYGTGPDWDTPVPLGAVLKAMEDNPETFRLQVTGGCSCTRKPMLIDFEETYGYNTQGNWTLYTWCPECHSRREIHAWNFQRSDVCALRMTYAGKENDKGQGLSNLTIFDVIDAVR